MELPVFADLARRHWSTFCIEAKTVFEERSMDDFLPFLLELGASTRYKNIIYLP